MCQERIPDIIPQDKMCRIKCHRTKGNNVRTLESTVTSTPTLTITIAKLLVTPFFNFHSVAFCPNTVYMMCQESITEFFIFRRRELDYKPVEKLFNVYLKSEMSIVSNIDVAKTTA